MVDKEIIRRKLIKISEYLQELARLEDISYSDYISESEFPPLSLA